MFSHVQIGANPAQMPPTWRARCSAAVASGVVVEYVVGTAAQVPDCATAAAASAGWLGIALRSGASGDVIETSPLCLRACSSDLAGLAAGTPLTIGANGVLAQQGGAGAGTGAATLAHLRERLVARVFTSGSGSGNHTILFNGFAT